MPKSPASALVHTHAPLIAQAMPHVAHVAIRNRGTFGGSLALADQAAELPACAVALGARLVLGSVRGTRSVAADDFFQGLYATDRAPDELLIEVEIPKRSGWRVGFSEFARRHGDFAMVGLAAAIAMDGDTTREMRLVYFGSEAHAHVAAHAAAAARGRPLDAATQTAIIESLDHDLDPIGNLQGRADTKRHLAAVLTRRVLARDRRAGRRAGMTEAVEVMEISLTVNGEAVRRRVPVRQHLVDFLRLELGLTATHLGCEHGICGACSVRLDGRVVRGCLILAVQADGGKVETVEGLTETGEIADLQDAFVRRNALQCGFCTPGMLMTASELLASGETSDHTEIRQFMSGNYCRCTGYQAIVEAIADTMARRRTL